MNLTINDFEGPLDLLLHLVKTSKMDIYEINIKVIIDKYLEFINSLDKYDLDKRSEYLVMAAELIHLKSRMLVSGDEDIDDDYEFNTEEELKEKLLEYQEYKNISNLMKEYEENRKQYLTKSPENLSEYKEKKDLSNSLELNVLIDAFLELRKRMEYQKPLVTTITKKELSVEEKVLNIRGLLKKQNKISFFELFESDNKEEIIVTFLAILSLGKEDKIKIYQEKKFGDIYVERIK